MLSLPLLLTFIATASAHGTVQGILTGSGTYYQGYSPSFQYHHPIPLVAGWSAPEDIDNGFIDPTKYSDPNIICHREATPAGAAVKISAGETLELQWTVWPESHHGPVIDYLARCPEGDCGGVDKTKLEFVKIGERGMVNWDVMPGKWASDELISNNNSWSITIPSTLKSGSYVLRHEIISLHSANNHNGAQNYPQCITLDVTASSGDDGEGGTEDLSNAGGVPATEFYTNEDPGIAVNIYESQSTYLIPGPTLWRGVGGKGAVQTSGGGGGSDAPEVTGSSSQAGTTPYTASSSFSSPTSTTSASAPGYSSHDDENDATNAASTTESCTSSAYSTPTTMTTLTSTTTATNNNPSKKPSPYSRIQALLDSLPSEALTRTIAVSTAAASADSYNSEDKTGWGGLPEKNLPEGWTLRDLLSWVQIGMKEVWDGKGKDDGNDGGKGSRAEGRHSRDFGSVGRV